MSKKVSIIIPVYNGANYVREAIDSALAQTYKNTEIIVVNDGSNDNGETKEACLSYGDKITYIEKENGGVSTALNLGIDKMTGDYFSWLSHDDLYYPEKVEKQMKELEKYDDNTILYSNVDLIDMNGNRFDSITYNHELLMEKPDYALLRGAISGITLLIPKKAFDDCGKFDVKLRCVQDYLKWFEMIDKYKFIHMEEILAASRVHPKQVTQTSPKMITEGNWLWSYMAENYPTKKKIEYEECVYFFYKEMENFLEDTPYKEAKEKVKELAEQTLQEVKEKAHGKDITVVVVNEEEKDSFEKTIQSLKNQTLKGFQIVIQGKSDNKNYKSFATRKEVINNIDTKYYTFLTAGVELKENWLERQMLIETVTKRGVLISDYPRPLRSGVINNLCSFLIPLDGVILEKMKNVEYDNDYQLMYDTAYEKGSFVTDEKYLSTTKENYKMNEVMDYLKRVLEGNKSNEYQIACLNYDISVLYNRHSMSGKKVFMYEPCNEYKELKFSRSFQIFKKYYDFKQRRRKRI